MQLCFQVHLKRLDFSARYSWGSTLNYVTLHYGIGSTAGVRYDNAARRAKETVQELYQKALIKIKYEPLN